MLHFHRQDVRLPHLVVIEGGRSEARSESGTRLHSAAAVVFVLLATLLAVAVDVLDSVPMWSHVALAGSAFVYWFSPEFTPTLGASGAVFGLMGALLVLALKVKAERPQATITYVRRLNRRGDQRHPPHRLSG